MKSKMMNVITADELTEALRLQYGEKFVEEINKIRSFLFDTDYINDVYKIYFFDECEKYTGESWQDETHIRIENCIKIFLQDTFPGYDSILIDVSW